MKCPKCGVDLELVKANFPYSEEHLQCPKCDGTYNKEEEEQ